ncbi:MAG: 16S rRNA (guanine(527)-N(7))-methyltransferase RsmG [Pyramidobacter sp.]|nr:16S rRNA (guanine(527)-N(7))-methyltransferase RsmG [Pyramidobacter sp.]
MEMKCIQTAPPLAPDTEQQLRRYGALLCSVNERVRLVGPRDEATLWDEHIADCLHLRAVMPENGSVIDVGTGGGLPGVVLALCRPDLQFTLLDSLSRKTNALREIVRELGMNNAEVVCARSEDMAQTARETFTLAVCRAVSECGIIAEYLSPLVVPGGGIAAMKGPSAEEELAPLTGMWDRLGLSEPEIVYYDMPDHKRHVILWKKIAPCPPSFPRRPGRAEKKPWWK